jgi:uncharacterized protein YbjT (DUF2867 family)
MKKAVVIGGTGMVGNELIKQLVNNKNYSEVVSLVRRRSGFTHPKLNEQLIDFDKPEEYKLLIDGDVLFSALGTTRANAKTKDAQYRVDFEYQFQVAQIAAQQGVKRYVLVSSAGANASSGNFYLRMKGQLDDAVATLGFETTSIIRPGQLDGNRKEKRLGEKISLKIMYFLNTLGLFRKYRPIQASEVASALMNAAEKQKTSIYTLSEVFELAR